MSLSPSPVSASPENPINPIASGCLQGVLGLVVGGAIALELIGRDPFGVVSVAEPVGRAADIARGNGGLGVSLGLFAMTWIPLMVSGLCGVFVHKSLPASIPTALLRMTGIASILLMVSEVGSRLIDHALSTGESSDMGTPLAMLAFEALCILLAAPLSSMVTRRRSPRAKSMSTRS